MGNPLMSIFGGGGSNIMMQAVGAMLRGDSPRDFMRSLAASNPALRGMNLDDINGTAEKLCRERGIDAEKLTTEIKQAVGGMIK